ncbi:MAG: energy-coupling factor transporter ATPase [Firmicutes bacterium]|nr:energy-coupling factor transporter ATPase [Bacillota bacterium]
MPLLEVRNLTHIYSQGTPFEHVALENVSFSLEKGEFVGIIGHTGSGKSTLIQHLNGLLKPSAGTVLLDGTDLWSSKAFTRQARFRIGLVFQYPEYQLFEETCYADIAFGPKNMKLPREEIDRRVRKAAALVGLTDEQLRASPFDLSGGQKRRVAIAGVIAMEPEILILDEPTAGLDPAGREEILGNILDYRRQNKATIVMVSHSMDDVARMADRLLVMNESHLAMDGTPEAVFRRADELMQMGLDIPTVTRVFSVLREKGLDVPTVYTMEQAIAALTGDAPC